MLLFFSLAGWISDWLRHVAPQAFAEVPKSPGEDRAEVGALELLTNGDRATVKGPRVR
jgi:hypothetical protein